MWKKQLILMAKLLLQHQRWTCHCQPLLTFVDLAHCLKQINKFFLYVSLSSLLAIAHPSGANFWFFWTVLANWFGLVWQSTVHWLHWHLLSSHFYLIWKVNFLIRLNSWNNHTKQHYKLDRQTVFYLWFTLSFLLYLKSRFLSFDDFLKYSL